MKHYYFLFAFLSVIAGLSAQTEVDKVKATVSKADIEGHISFLASDELRGRQTGSHELDIAASYLANTLKRYGIKPGGENGTYYQQVPLIKTGVPTHMELTADGMEGNDFINFSVDNFAFSGEAVFLGYGTEKDFEKKNLEGKLIFVNAGTAEAEKLMGMYQAGKSKKEMAMAVGAAGLIELANLGDKDWATMSRYFNEERIALGSDDEAPKFIHLWKRNEAMDLKSGKKMKAALKIEGIEDKKVGGKNVVGYLEGTDPELKEEFIMYSAHYDHVGVGKPNAEMDSIYNGTRDNAVGTVTVLSVAENFSKFPTKRSSLFVFFTAEEKGLLGSKYYADNPTVALDRVVYCWNSDNGGYNDTSKITIFGLHRTTVTDHIIAGGKEFGLEVIDDPAPEQNLFDRSDNVSFAAKGVPAPTYSMGFTAFNDEIYKYYHQVTDNPDTVDYDYLFKFFSSYVLTSRLIANDPETPFWTEGDKYYDAGVELYKNKKKAGAEVLD